MISAIGKPTNRAWSIKKGNVPAAEERLVPRAGERSVMPGAGLVDLQPPGGTLGSLTASVAPSVGLAAGALGAGALVQFGPQPLRLVYWVQLAL